MRCDIVKYETILRNVDFVATKVQDATKFHTCCQDAQDTLDANLILLVSGYKTDTPDTV